jgi:hypothetical protein
MIQSPLNITTKKEASQAARALEVDGGGADGFKIRSLTTAILN